jgi:hypothetical protein
MPATHRKDWSGRGDLNSRPPAPKAGGLPKTTLLFSTLLLKQNNLVVIVACGWLCANVPICLLGGHKSWHNRDGAPSREGAAAPPKSYEKPESWTLSFWSLSYRAALGGQAASDQHLFISGLESTPHFFDLLSG